MLAVLTVDFVLAHRVNTRSSVSGPSARGRVEALESRAVAGGRRVALMVDGRVAGVRLAELVASLSVATDLALGQPQEHILRQTVIATRLARLAEFSSEEQAAVYYVSLLAWVGCVADSHEMARWFGDDTHIRAASYEVNRAGLPMLRFLLGNLASQGSSWRRISMTGRFMTSGVREVMDSLAAHCQTTSQIADRIGLAAVVSRALPQVLERWDGKGGPAGLRGEQIEPVMRVAQIGSEAEVCARVHGDAAALEMLAERSGSQFDPALAELCGVHGEQIFGELDAVDAWSVVIDGCAPLDRAMDEAELRSALETFADYADVKSPWFTGHSRAVAALAGEAARCAGCPSGEVELVEYAGLVCRLGGIGVSAATWGRPGPLSSIEWERVRTVPYLTERVLARQPRLAQIGAVAGLFHERMDGSGYPRGLSGAAIPQLARLLAAAEVYQALREERPHRAALSRTEARTVVLDEVSAGRLDAVAVNAVLAAAGHQSGRAPSAAGGLSAREVEVLALLVRGLSNKQIAALLSITARTVGSHVEHIYTKIGVSARGAAAMYAMRHGLVDAGLADRPLPARSGE
jgi:HD-GYP domain-containing protein (c-di-GMP phosphodiesterase class II)